MNTLQGRVALVTGSSRGIGAAIAVAFTRTGPCGCARPGQGRRDHRWKTSRRQDGGPASTATSWPRS
jgi:NAD(P)-dependent dehydrogenase (short-subunit alcohol dehydrogenase family)